MTRSNGALASVFAAAREREDVMAPLIALARQTGWLAFHPYRSNRSAPGFPDLVLVRSPSQGSVQYGPPYLIFAECKTEAGRLSSFQRTWGAALSCVGVLTEGAVVYCVVRPSTRHRLEALLLAPAGREAPGVGRVPAARMAKELLGHDGRDGA